MGLANFTGQNPPQNPNNPNNGNQNGNGYPGMPGANPFFAGPQQNDDDISDLFINYNDEYKIHDRVLFRDNVIQQLLSVLIGKDKPNALLVGPAGTGKTAIVETLANMLANDDPLIPDQLKGYTIYELPLANVVAGASLVGQLENNVKRVVETMEDPKNKAILFIDEIHQLLGGSEIYDKIAQILKPALARGHIRVIGATTTQEANNIMKDPAFSRRFSRIIVDELTREQTVTILDKAKPSFMNHYKNVNIDSNLLELIAQLADQYRPAGSHRPDNALTLLDRTLGEAVVSRKVEMKHLQSLVLQDPNDVTSANMLAALQQNPPINITKNQVKNTAIALATGNQKKTSVDITTAYQGFSYIKGQDEAVKTAISMMQRSESNLFPKKKPVTMLFIGPSGVGKTEVAKIIAKELTGQKPIVLNMTEYSDPATINRIIGSPAGYVGYSSHAEMPFDELESNPYSVILLDEFEKAHPAVKRLFFSVFDEGTLTDNHGKKIDFSKAIIIATTNAAHQTLKHNMGFGTGPSIPDASIKDLSKFFDPALLNRFQYLVNFNPISKDIYRSILADTYAREAARINADKPALKLDAVLSDDVLNRLTDESYHEEFGARPAYDTVQKYIEDMVIPAP